jgi:hypothetical protein
MNIEDFSGRTPGFQLEDYFDGKTEAYGLFEDRFGNLRREFTVRIEGRRDGRTIVLDEQFAYSDGESDRRIWTIEQTGEGEYLGRADDVVGVARGTARGNALHWRYDMDLKMGDGTWRVHFDDWMFLQPDGVLINRARVTKWGLEIGEVTIAFVKPAAREAALSRASEHARQWFGAASSTEAR